MSWKAWIIIIVIGLVASAGLWGDLHNVSTSALPAAAPPVHNIPTILPPPPSTSLTWWDSWNALPQSLQFLAVAVVGLIVLLVFIALLKSTFKGVGGSGAFKAGSFFSQVLTGLALTGLLFAVLYPLNPTAPLWTTDEGHFHLLMYGLAIIVSVMIATNLKGFGKFSALVILIVVFAILGPRTLMLYDPDGVVWAKLHLPSGSSHSSNTASYAFRCDGRESRPIQAAFQPQPLVSDARLANTTVVVLYGQVLLEGPGGYVVQGKQGILEQNIQSAAWEPETITALTAAQYTKRCLPK